MKILLVLKIFAATFLGTFAGIFLFFSVGQLIFRDFYKAFVILSGSMEPVILTGSVAIVHPKSSYQVGDIITFKTGGGKSDFVTHRISEIKENELITKGDANEEVDGAAVLSNKVIGKVLFSIPYLGYGVDFAKTPQGFILMIIVPATIIIYEELKSIKNELAASVKKKILSISSDDLAVHSNKLPKQVFVIPLVGVIFVSFFFATKAYYLDMEQNQQNILGAASSFSTPTPTPSSTPNSSPTPTPQTQAISLVINEVLPDSSCSQGNTEAQWLEVYNGYPNTVNLKNFKITDGVNTIDLVTANNVNIPSGAFALLAHNSAIWNNCYDDNGVITANLGGQLDINSGQLQLLDSNSLVIDTVIWGNSPLNPIQNQSVERNPDGFDTALGVNFAAGDFVVQTTPFPGL